MASFTTTCAISGTIWDGPSGCPIISPSNWQTYVLDNSSVLANHDHSGSAGEGLFVPPASFFPSIDYDYFSAFFPIASSNWVIEASAQDPGYTQNVLFLGAVSTCTQGASIVYDVYLRSGRYRVDIIHSMSPNGGIITACLNGASIGTCSNYHATGFANNRGLIATPSVANAGEARLAFAIDTQGTSSTGYMGRLHMIAMWRTGS